MGRTQKAKRSNVSAVSSMTPQPRTAVQRQNEKLRKSEPPVKRKKLAQELDEEISDSEFDAQLDKLRAKEKQLKGKKLDGLKENVDKDNLEGDSEDEEDSDDEDVDHDDDNDDDESDDGDVNSDSEDVDSDGSGNGKIDLDDDEVADNEEEDSEDVKRTYKDVDHDSDDDDEESDDVDIDSDSEDIDSNDDDNDEDVDSNETDNEDIDKEDDEVDNEAEDSDDDSMEHEAESATRSVTKNQQKKAKPDSKKKRKKKKAEENIPIEATEMAQDLIAKASRDKRTLFLKNLPKCVTPDMIRSLSSDVLAVRLQFCRSTKSQVLRSAFVEFIDEETAVINKAKFEHKKIGEHAISVDFVGEKSTFRPKKPQFPTSVDPKKLFVSGIRNDTTVEDLKKLFPAASAIDFPRYKKEDRPKGFAFIHFTDEQACKAAHAMMQNQVVSGRVLTVMYAKKSQSESKDSRKNKRGSHPPRKNTKTAAANDKEKENDEDKDSA